MIKPVKPEMLAVFLDRQAGDLANDLEWTLKLLAHVKEHLPKHAALAERYMEVMTHLRTRRSYEAACNEVEVA